MEAENKLRRAGKLPKDKKEFYVKGDGLEIKPKDEDAMVHAVKVVDVLTLQEVEGSSIPHA